MNGHTTIAGGVVASAQTATPFSAEPGQYLAGTPAIEGRTWLQAMAVAPRLPELMKRLHEGERKLSA